MKKFRHVREGYNADGTKQEINSPPVHEYPVDRGERISRGLTEQDSNHTCGVSYAEHKLNDNDEIVCPVERAGTLGEVIDRRVQVYGNPVHGFAEIAELWTTYLGFPVQAHQVPIMMILLKIQRSKTSPDYSDHSDDIEGYLDIFRQVIGEDMIEAKSVNEYIAKKWPGEAS